jgi:hypothetical protein
MEEGQNVPAPTGGFFYSQICNFPKESFILSSPCNSVLSSIFMEPMNLFQGIDSWAPEKFTNSGSAVTCECSSDGIFKTFKEPKKSIPPAYVAWRASTTT